MKYQKYSRSFEKYEMTLDTHFDVNKYNALDISLLLPFLIISISF